LEAPARRAQVGRPLMATVSAKARCATRVELGVVPSRRQRRTASRTTTSSCHHAAHANASSMRRPLQRRHRLPLEAPARRAQVGRPPMATATAKARCATRVELGDVHSRRQRLMASRTTTSSCHHAAHANAWSMRRPLQRRRRLPLEAPARRAQVGRPLMATVIAKARCATRVELRVVPSRRQRLMASRTTTSSCHLAAHANAWSMRRPRPLQHRRPLHRHRLQ